MTTNPSLQTSGSAALNQTAIDACKLLSIAVAFKQPGKESSN